MPQARYEAARLREQLPVIGEKEVRLTESVSGKTFAAHYTPADLARVLADHEVIPALQECIGRALSAMRMRGGDACQVRSVLLLGPGCALPAVQEAVRSRFTGADVYADHPLDAVARGAAEYAAPAAAQDRIACSYALRYWDPAVQEHHYRFLVHSGTRTEHGQVARIVISAAYDGQTLLGIPLYEIGGTAGGAGDADRTGLGHRRGCPARRPGTGRGEPGTGRACQRALAHPAGRDPPARKGEPRFECTFTIDPERNLCLSARDLVTGMLVKVNTPVHRMT